MGRAPYRTKQVERTVFLSSASWLTMQGDQIFFCLISAWKEVPRTDTCLSRVFVVMMSYYRDYRPTITSNKSFAAHVIKLDMAQM